MYQGSWSKGHSGHSVPTKVSLDKVSYWPKCDSAVNGLVGRQGGTFKREKGNVCHLFPSLGVASFSPILCLTPLQHNGIKIFLKEHFVTYCLVNVVVKKLISIFVRRGSPLLF